MKLTAFIQGSLMIVALALINVEGDEGIKPSVVVHNVFTNSEQDTEPYIYSQFQLENIAESASLYDLPPDGRDGLIQEMQRNPQVQQIINQCQQFHTQPQCSQSIYRTYDGTCNNLKHPVWGSSNYLMNRLLPPAYDGIRGLRKSASGGPLPNARNISLKLVDIDQPTKDVSALFTFFGQFIAHDVSSSPVWAEQKVVCASTAGQQLKSCINVCFDKDDPFYKNFDFPCVGIKRTAPYPKCNFEQRSPQNKVTSFLDASPLYGYHDDIANYLRLNDGTGKLKIQNTSKGELLPPNPIQDLAFCPHLQTSTCFLAGDERVNQHAMLTTTHTFMHRYHNSIADKLKELNPNWPEEKLYQETRRIVIAVYQYIVYKEYIIWIVPSDMIKKFDLDPDDDSQFNEETDPSGLASFTTGSFRLHSMIPTQVSKFLPDLKFKDTYSNPDLLHEGKTEPLVAGAWEIPSQKNDPWLVEDVDNYLYKPPGTQFGLDLTVLDIQRERDHGLAPYIDYVHYCSNGDITINDFSDLNQIMPPENVALVKSMYDDVRDIDLIIGIYMEKLRYGIVNGFTASCISAEQFHRLKFGDNFFFSHTNSRYPFTKDQLKAIRSTSFAQLLCQAGDFTSMRKYPMKVPGLYNYVEQCKSVPSMDLGPWQDPSAGGQPIDQQPKHDDSSSSKTCYFYIFCF